MTTARDADFLTKFGGMCDKISFLPMNTCVSHIERLSDVFLEWYLFDDQNCDDVKTFLLNNQLENIFSEKQFIDLMTGAAYLNDDGVRFVCLTITV